MKYIGKDRLKSEDWLHEKNNELVILIPVYDETTIIKECINYFADIADRLNIRVYIITTSKEGSMTNNPTYNIARDNVRGNLSIIHYPGTEGFKAHQINYALNVLEDELVCGRNQYVGIFDADSRPDIRGLRYVIGDRDRASAYQMFSIYSSNLTTPTNLENASAVFQTRWTFSFEFPRILKNYQHEKTVRLMYFIGHGLFFKVNDSFKGFPEDTITEDISLGYEFSFNNLLPKPVPYFDYSTVPRKLKQRIIQTSRWFNGEILLFNNAHKAITTKSMGTIKILALTAERYFLISQWLLGSLLLPIMFVVAILSRQSVLLALVMVETVLYVYTLHKEVMDQFNLSNRNILYIFLICSVNSFGPLYAIPNTLMGLLRFKAIQFIKTQR